MQSAQGNGFRYADFERMTASKSITVLVVDDHALIRAALVSLLEDTSDIKVIAEASNGAAQALARTERGCM
jgi:CheY-like chemotaxis protein